MHEALPELDVTDARQVLYCKDAISPLRHAVDVVQLYT